MKFFKVLMLCFVSIFVVAQELDIKNQLEEAEASQDFDKLALLYTQLINSGDANVINYLSLAAVTQKMGDLGKARLNIEKAKLIDPNNQKVIDLKNDILDDIDSDFVVIEQNWIKTKVNGFIDYFSPMFWLVINLISLLTLIIGLVYRLKIKTSLGKKLSKPLLLAVSAFLFVLSLLFGVLRENQFSNAKKAVALNQGIGKISASADSPDSFNYTAGDLFKITEQQGEWTKVLTSEYKEVWIETNKLGLVIID